MEPVDPPLFHPSETAVVLASPAKTELDLRRELAAESAIGYATEAQSAATRRAYVADYKAFRKWCAMHEVPSLPTTPATVGAYLGALADQGKRPASIARALSGITDAQRKAGHTWDNKHPQIRNVLAGIRRKLGVAPKQKAPVLVENLSAMVNALGKGLRGVRDHALLLLGFDGAFRRSELSALNVEDIQETRDGFIVTVRRSKTDQEGEGMVKAIPYASNPTLCTVRALRDYLATAEITEGPVFREITNSGNLGPRRLGGRAIAEIVKRAAKDAGLDPKRFAGHSLRAGFVTTATLAGKPVDAIMRQTGHADPRTVSKYVRRANPFDANAIVGLK